MERKFKFENFFPSSSTQRYCSRKFLQMWEKSPSYSTVFAKVVKLKDKKYRTSIFVRDQRGEQYIEATDPAVLVSVGLAADKLSGVLRNNCSTD